MSVSSEKLASSLIFLGWHRQEGGEGGEWHTHLAPLSAGVCAGTKVMRPGELALPFTSCSTQDSRPCTWTGQHSRGDTGCTRARELDPSTWVQGQGSVALPHHLTFYHLQHMGRLTLRSWECRSGPASHLIHLFWAVELPWYWRHGSEGMRIGELTLSFAGHSTGRDSRGSAWELTLVVRAQETWWADQLSYLTGPDPGLWVGPPQQ